MEMRKNEGSKCKTQQRKKKEIWLKNGKALSWNEEKLSLFYKFAVCVSEREGNSN